MNETSQWDFPWVPGRSAEPEHAWVPVHMPPCLQWWFVWPYSLFPLQSLYLSFAPCLFLSISVGQERGEITYRSSMTFAALAASRRGGRVNRQPVALGRDRPV